jgi:hypothetical protein
MGMSSSVKSKTSTVYLSHDDTERARALSPVANVGAHAGEPSLTALIREAIELGELARPLAPRGRLPWAALRKIVRRAVDARAPRRGPS